MCEVLSPGGHYQCSNVDCDGHGHVWIHASAAPDRKGDESADDY